MEVFIVVILIVLLVVGISLKLLSSKEEVSHLEDSLSKFDFMFFNNEGLKCKDGKVINCNIIIYASSSDSVSRESLSEQYMKELQKEAIIMDPFWFFSKDEDHENFFLSVFKKSCDFMKVDRLEIASIAFADECFTDQEIQEEIRLKEKEEIKKKIEEQEARFKREREEQEARLKAETESAIRKAEEERDEAMRKVQEELEAAMRKADEELKHAIEREEAIREVYDKNKVFDESDPKFQEEYKRVLEARRKLIDEE